MGKSYFLRYMFVGIIMLISPQTFAAYCGGAWASAGSWSISNVTIGSINNSTGWSAGGYGNYTGLSSGDIPRGSATSVSVTIATPNFATLAFRVFFDWNSDGDFVDAGEKVYEFTGNNQPASVTKAFNVTPAAGTAIGNVRMRVICFFATSVYPDESSCACSGCQQGEAEDYNASVSLGLPIQLLNFDAYRQNDKSVLLNWATAAEINNDYFTIERSADGINFFLIAVIRGAGNSNDIIQYSTIDEFPVSGWNYYRLKQTDYDGKFEYSQVRPVLMTDSKGICTIFNRPDNNVYINVVCEKNDQFYFAVYDPLGKELYAEHLEATNDQISSIVDINSICASGVYLVRVVGLYKQCTSKVMKF